MIIKIQLLDQSFEKLDTSDILSINDVNGTCVIRMGSGQNLLTYDSYIDIIKLLGNFINIKN